MAWQTPIDWLGKAVGYDVTRADLATISDSLNALGVPTEAVAYEPGHTGWDPAPTMDCAYAISGHLMTMWLSAVGTSDILPTCLTLPGSYVPAAALPGGYFTGGIDFLCRVVDSGGGSAVGQVTAFPGNNTLTFLKDIAGTAFTTSGGKAIVAVLTVPI